MVNHGEVAIANKLRIHEGGIYVRSVFGFWIHCAWKEIEELELAPDKQVLTVRLLDLKPPTMFKTARASTADLPRLVEKCMVFPEFTERYHAKKAS